MARTSIFVDGGPFMDGIRHQGMSLDMNMMGLLGDLAQDDDITASHFFAAPVPAHPYPNKARNEQATFDRLRSQGLTLHITRAQVIVSVFVERGVETALSVQMLSDAHADRFDRALLISRREDFRPLVAAVRALGKRVDLAHFHYDVASNPLEADADSLTIITREHVLKHWISGPRPMTWEA